MSKSISLQFQAFPSLIKMYPRMMTSKKPSILKEGQTYSPLHARIENITADPQLVNQFAEVCSYPKDMQVLPIPYPHILAAPLQMALLNHKAFPVKLLGLVHIGNSITQHRAINLQDVMDIETSISGYEDTPKGQIFRMNTEIFSSGEIVWEETLIFLARKKNKGKKKPKKKNKRADNVVPESMVGTKVTSWNIKANMGRRFAKVSGDVNPIHLADFSAKLFGFKKAIIHGVWTMSRSIAELEEHNQLKKVKIDVDFKLPVFMPTWVSFQHRTSDDQIEFSVKDSAGEKPHMSGRVTFL